MQLKRNKEMEFETLKKSHKKQIIMGALALCAVGGALTFNLTRAKYKVTNNIDLAKGTVNYKPYDFKIMAMYQSDDGTNYSEINNMPESGYVINENKSYCTTDNKTQIKGKIKTVNGIHGLYNILKNDKCYLYFDKSTKIENTTIGNLTVKKYTPDFAYGAYSNDGVFAVEDEMYEGTSYYWRGAVTNNYVKFASFCWRIIRINGDGSIRLIYDGSTCHMNGTNTTDSLVQPTNGTTTYAYNTSYNQANYVGWTYEGQLQRPANNATGTSSNAKTELESWYSSNITGANASKVADGKYCNDRNITSSSIWAINGSKRIDYLALDRINKKIPTLSCLPEDIYILKIGLITADDVMYAGGNNKNNSLYYLYNGQNYWTMTPCCWISGNAIALFVNNGGDINNTGVNSKLGLRPVINLRSDVTFSGGDGTLDNPYIVQ